MINGFIRLTIGFRQIVDQAVFHRVDVLGIDAQHPVRHLSAGQRMIQTAQHTAE
jgi:hypothetical protein